MYTVLLAVCAESVVWDGSSNQISIFNVFEEVQAPEFPLLVPKLTSLVYLRRDEGDPGHGEGWLVFEHDGVQIARLPVQLNFQGQLRNRIISEVRGVAFPAPGMMRVWLEIGGQRLGEWEIRAQLVRDEARQPAPTAR